MQNNKGLDRSCKGCTKFRRNSTWTCECFGKLYVRHRVNGRLSCVEKKGVDLATRKTKKCGCLVMMYATMTRGGQWNIERVVLEHVNNQLNPKISR
ncbi:Arginine--tRNA ligase [Bienertia sinuspersici]